MVKKHTRWFLRNFTHVDPKHIAGIFGEDEDECWEYLLLYQEALNREAAIRKKEREDINNQVQDFIEEIPNKHNIKVNSLIERLRLAGITGADTTRLMSEYRVLTGKEERVTGEDIAKAKEYPITNLIESRRNMAKCPFHPDKTASLYLKNNFFHCFGCDKSGDVIDFVMETEGMSFKEAIRRLT